ncbi:MAG: glycosyltransferase family 2 protein [Bacteroidota bacterium]|jgi:glycosyltransferase involved in cell wall biosynthesis|nr:glycosyltransferase [Cytophagales bacterium]MCE2957848.1 glycosyltransferase [Flammeovirgaceae bacterium]MCZ8072181.1 glycosyltransferase [Cytophagales bacterium]
MIKLSVVIITYNEEKNIGRCIDSVIPIADEIVVVDSFSTDGTKKICLSKKVKFIEHPFEGHIQQKNYALDQTSYEHVLSLDADEYLSPELTSSILSVKKNWPAEAYEMNRLSSYGGRWMKLSAWYPDRKLRLWNKKIGSWGGDNPHDKVILNKKVGVMHLRGDLMHEAYDNAAEFLTKIQSYSDIFANEKRFVLKSSSFKIFYKTIYTFFFNFFLKLGLFGGYEGAIISMSNTNYTFYKYSKLREANRNLKISLIITTYNRKDALELVLMSVMTQSCLPNEVIIADDGSTDDTRKLIEFYQSIFPIPLVHCWHEDLGFRLSAIRNKAIARAKHEYIVMIDGDIVLPANFIKGHKEHAWRGQFIQGSRVLLLKRTTEKMLGTKKMRITPFTRDIDNRLNAIESNLLSALFSYFRSGHTNVRGANLSFWRDDLLTVNGFNEDFVGWGREDSEFAVRMNNAGIKRKHVKFAAFGYHLYHPENSRKQLPINDAILLRTIQEKKSRCENGIQKPALTATREPELQL